MPNLLKLKRGAAASIPTGQLAEPLFTSDTYDLYIGTGASNQRFQKYIASGTSTQFLKGDGSLDSTSYQTALTFSAPLVNTSGTISIPAATGSVNGYLTSTDWTTFNSKEPAITAGTTLQYYRGDKTFQTLDTAAVPENGPVYFTEPRVRATVLTGLNLSGGGTISATDSVLTAFGKVQNQISALVGGATYQGTWNASTNTPTLASGTGTKGYYYVVSVAGSTNLDGITDWKIGDWAIFNGTTWDKVDNTDAVSSVNGFTGAVNLALDNISDVSAASPTNAQLLRFNGTSSLWENWTPTFEPALTKGNLTESTSSVLTITGGTGAVIGSGTTIQVAQASGSVSGYLSSTDWTTFNNKQATITLTTTGTSGAATFSSNTLNIPQYQAALTNPVTGTGTNNYLTKFTTTGSTIGNSNIIDNGSAVLINTDTAASNLAGYVLNIRSSSSNIAQSSIAFQGYDKTSRWVINAQDGADSYNLSIYSNTVSIGNSPSYILKLSLTQAGVLRLPNYTTNGFVKFSGGDGTISVDTTSYLPLTGGTLTGALSGTSATFSINAANTSQLTLTNTNGAATQQMHMGAFSGNAYFSTNWYYNGSAAYDDNTKKSSSIVLNGDGSINLNTVDTANTAPNTRLSISSTGNVGIGMTPTGLSKLDVYGDISTSNGGNITAAGMITAGSTLSTSLNAIIGTDIAAQRFVPTGTTIPTVGMYLVSGTASLNGVLGFSTGTTKRLEISATGAATFSNSITSSYTYNGGGTGMIHLTSGGTEGGSITLEKTSGTAQKYKVGNSGTEFFIYNETAGNKPLAVSNGGDLYLRNTAALFFGPTSVTYIVGSTTSMSLTVDSGEKLKLTTTSVLAGNPSEGATGEGLIAGRSFKIDGTGSGQTAKMYMVSNTLSDTYASGLTAQYSNFAGDKAAGFNLNTNGDFELYAKDSSFKKIFTATKTQYLRLAAKGIQFNGDTADANSLDDYEEGTWTPVVKVGTTTNTASVNRGVYTKIGRVVYIQTTITGITKSGTGNVTIEGLPFTVGATSTFGDVQGTLRWDDITSDGIIYPYFNENTNTITLQDFSNTGYTGPITNADLSATYQLYGISGFYMV
jgi:hypothetical protein